MTIQDLYRAKKRSVQDCLDLIETGDVVCFAGEGGEATAICEQFHTIQDRGVRQVLCIKGRDGSYPFVATPGLDGIINTRSNFYAKPFRDAQKNGNVSYLPLALNDMAESLQQFRPHNVFIAQVPPMDEQGNFWLGCSLMWEAGIFPSCKTCKI